LLNGLPQRIREIADLTFQAFEKNPLSPMLGLHALHDTRQGRHQNGSYSVSVTSRYRAIYVVDGQTNVWYWIGSHEDYNTFVGSKKK
jgi:hypothetical protein